MSSDPAQKPSWIKRIGAMVTVWAGLCGVGFVAGMSPRPMLLAGVICAVSVASWLASDGLRLATSTDWHITEGVVIRPRGADAHVVALERLIGSCSTSASSRTRLHQLLTALADERLLSLKGIDRQLDPAGARAALGPDLDDFITTANPASMAMTFDRTSLLVNRIESL